MRKLLSLTRKIVPVTEKILFIHIGQGPSVNQFLDCVFLTSLTLIIVWMMTRFFPVVSGEIIYWKIRFPGNFKSYPTLVDCLVGGWPGGCKKWK